MKIELEAGFKKKLSRRVEGYEFTVGVLQDKDHFKAMRYKKGEREVSSYAGGPVRKKSRIKSGLTIGQVLIDNMKRLGLNILVEPFEKEDSDLLKFMREFLKEIVKDNPSGLKRVENLLQAVVRNPILKKEYGDNSSLTKSIKGFDRHLIDTGQVFRQITAKAKRVKK